MSEPLEIHVVSDSTGETAARFAEAVERQFPDEEFEIVRHPRITSVDDVQLAGGGVAGLAAQLSPAELDELAAVLSDEALARLLLAAARQLRRRLSRGGRAGPRPSAALDRAARQLAAELGGQGAEDDL